MRYQIIEFCDREKFMSEVNNLSQGGWEMIESTFERIYNNGKDKNFPVGWSYSCVMRFLRKLNDVKKT